MAEGIVYAILGKIGEYLVAPIGRQFGYVCCYNNIIQKLRAEVADLENMRDGEHIRVESAREKAEKINPVVVTWLNKAEEMKTESERILEDAANGWCLNLKSRYSVSRRATKKTRQVTNLRDKGKFDWVSCPVAPPAVISTVVPTFFESRMSTTNEIMEALEKAEINMIGLCGMGGVGKTTMAKEVSARAMAEKIFEKVTMAVVSQTRDISKIQGEVGGMLGLRLEEGIGIHARAAILRERLTNGEKILVILDDVWEGLELDEIGIPAAAGDSKGCKVLVTSRIESLCSDMGTQKNFTVHYLWNEEAWDLFKEEAKIGADTPPHLHSVAQEVAKECCGLPIAIVTVAKALRKREMHAWKDALRQLRNSTVTNIPGMHKNVYSSIELSYNYLESEQAKSLLLLCCMFPDDYIIQTEKLFRCGVGLQLFEDVETLEAIRERVESLVDILISYHLLEDDEHVDGYRRVKMHDVIRDAGIFIASKKEDVYKVTHDTGLKEWLQNDRHHERYTAICLMARDMVELPANLHFSKLKLLQLESAQYFQRPQAILSDSLREMGQLQVIGVKRMCVEFLAPPLNFWRNLRTLYLDDCQLRGNDISFVGSLKNLEILSFFQSNLDGLPSEIGQLGNLKLLDLRCESGPSIIPFGVLMRLMTLEELYMGSYFFRAEVEEHNASVSEINLLSHLKTLQIVIPRGPEFLLELKNFHFKNLKKFNFDMYGSWGRLPSYQLFSNNCLSLNEVDMRVVRESNVNVLARTTEVLELRELRDLKNVLKYIDEMGCVNLKDLCIRECDEVEYVIDADDSVPAGVTFINLESLYISEMNNLTEICRGNLPSGFFNRLQNAELNSLPAIRHLWRDPIQPPSFGNLRDLEISKCDAMRSVFSQAVVKCLVKLEKLKISGCKMLEEVVSIEDNEDKNVKIEFPKLKRLRLGEFFALPKLRRFYSGADNGTKQTLLNQQVVLPRMEYLGLCGLTSLEAVFDFEGLKVREEHTQIKRYDQPELTHIWRMAPKEIKGLQNLRHLEVIGCPKLRYVLSHVMAEMLVNLQEIIVDDCDMVEEIVSKQEEVEEKMDTIVFPQLHALKLKGLNSIAAFSSWNHGFEFPSLETLVIKNCHNMNIFCPEPLSTPKLERVEVDDGRALTGDLNNFMQHLQERTGPKNGEDGLSLPL